MIRLNEEFDSKNSFYDIVKTFITAILIALVINSFIANAKVQGLSMYPTFNNNDLLVVNKMAYVKNDYNYNDIIVFRDKQKKNYYMIKRIIGLPGDKIVITDGKVYRNDIPLNEPYLKDGVTDGNLEVIVPENSLFVMGDNRLNSLDSRFEAVGFVNFSRVIGRVVFRIFPTPSKVK